jgi:hypothetical protein
MLTARPNRLRYAFDNKPDLAMARRGLGITEHSA